jgi:hypothetical protein
VWNIDVVAPDTAIAAVENRTRCRQLTMPHESHTPLSGCSLDDDLDAHAVCSIG